MKSTLAIWIAGLVLYALLWALIVGLVTRWAS